MAEHKEDCAYRRARALSAGVECEHCYDLCPTCDPCTCPAANAPHPSAGVAPMSYTPSLESQRRYVDCPQGDTATHYEPPQEWRPQMEPSVGEYHWRGGLTFKRLACGCVRIASWRQREDGQWFRDIVAFIPAAEWASIAREVARAD